MPIIVNHVLSKNMYSKIFEAIFRYIQNYSNPDEVKHIFTTRPIENADIYHYHRPNLEDEFFPNSFSTVHHDLHDTDGWLGMEKFINAYKQMAKIICLNKTQQTILQEFGIEHTTVIPWGYNENIFSPKPLETDNRVSYFRTAQWLNCQYAGYYVTPIDLNYCLDSDSYGDVLIDKNQFFNFLDERLANL